MRSLAIVALTILPLLLADGADAGVSLFSVSAYDDSSGPGLGITASGAHTAPGIAACGPSWAFGTLFILPDGTTLICRDRGGAVTDRHLDRWMTTKEEALRHGRHTWRVMWVR
jgi:3D (Asp-Asp-Asp) domain-containing protein